MTDIRFNNPPHHSYGMSNSEKHRILVKIFGEERVKAAMAADPKFVENASK